MNAFPSLAHAQSRPAPRGGPALGSAIALCAAALLATSACSPAFLGGAAVGVLGTGAAYEYKQKRELDQIERSFERGEISKEEYLRRKKEIEDTSVVR